MVPGDLLFLVSTSQEGIGIFSSFQVKVTQQGKSRKLNLQKCRPVYTSTDGGGTEQFKSLWEDYEDLINQQLIKNLKALQCIDDNL